MGQHTWQVLMAAALCLAACSGGQASSSSSTDAGQTGATIDDATSFVDGGAGCSGETPAWNAEALVCECTATSCPAERTCDLQLKRCVGHACVPSCAEKTPLCNPTTLACECTASSCGAGESCDEPSKLCAARSCQPACAEGSVCNPTTLACDRVTDASGGTILCSAQSCPAGTVTLDELKAAASVARAYIEGHQQVPTAAQVGKYRVPMSTFLSMLVQGTLQLPTGSTTPIPVTYVPLPTAQRDTTVRGRVPQSEFLKIAGDVKSYMDSSGKSPDYAYQMSLGEFMSFDNLIYMYAMVLDYSRTSGKLADWALMLVFSKAGLTLAELEDVSSQLRASIEANRRVPSYVGTSNGNVTMPSLLKMMVTAVLQLAAGDRSPLELKSYPPPTAQRDTTVRGRVPQSEFLKIAGDVKSYMDSSGKSPDYAYQMSLGEFMSFDNLVYMYAMILDYHHASGNLADWAELVVFSKEISIGSILAAAARYGYCSTCQDAACMLRVGCGSCWAMSEYLCNELASAHISSRIVQYATSMASNHRSIQYYAGGWVDAPYEAYGLDWRFKATANKPGFFVYRQCY